MTYDSLLTDRCRVLRRTPGAFNPGTGLHDPPTDDERYAGPCRVSAAPARGAMGRSIQIAEEAVIEHGRWVFLPLEATGLKVEDVVEVVVSEDVDLIGREMTVRDVAAEPSPNSALAARWLICEDILEGP